jgi:hypothetical protein
MMRTGRVGQLAVVCAHSDETAAERTIETAHGSNEVPKLVSCSFLEVLARSVVLRAAGLVRPRGKLPWLY